MLAPFNLEETVKVARLDETLLELAEDFAVQVIDDRNFNYLSHAHPAEMLTDEWEIYVIIEENKIIAWAQIQKFPGRLTKQHVCKVGFIVLPEWRGKGYGGYLLRYVIEKCRLYRKIVAHVYADNVVMLGMFLKQGFIIEGFYTNEVLLDKEFRHVVSLARHQDERKD